MYVHVYIHTYLSVQVNKLMSGVCPRWQDDIIDNVSLFTCTLSAQVELNVYQIELYRHVYIRTYIQCILSMSPLLVEQKIS